MKERPIKLGVLIQDVAVGGTYLTLLNTLANMGKYHALL